MGRKRVVIAGVLLVLGVLGVGCTSSLPVAPPAEPLAAATRTPKPTFTATALPPPSATPTDTPVPTHTPEATPTPDASPTPRLSPTPTASATAPPSPTSPPLPTSPPPPTAPPATLTPVPSPTPAPTLAPPTAPPTPAFPYSGQFVGWENRCDATQVKGTVRDQAGNGLAGVPVQVLLFGEQHGDFPVTDAAGGYQWTRLGVVDPLLPINYSLAVIDPATGQVASNVVHVTTSREACDAPGGQQVAIVNFVRN